MADEIRPGETEHDRIVRRIRERNRRLSHSVWTDKPVLMPPKSVWLEETAPLPDTAKAQEPAEVDIGDVLTAGEPEPEVLSEPLPEPVEIPVMDEDPGEYEEAVLPLLHDRRAARKRELSITFDDQGRVQINEVVKKGKRKQVTVNIPGERYAEYRRRSVRNDKSSRRVVTMTIPITHRPEPEPEPVQEPDRYTTMVITPPELREQSKGRSYEDPEFSVTPEAEEIAAAIASEEEFVREYIPEKERLGRTIQQATARIRAMKAAGIVPEPSTSDEIVRVPSGDDLIGYEAARKMLEEQIKEAERQLLEEPEPEPIKPFERAPKPRFHKPEFEFLNSLLCIGALTVGFVTAVIVLKDGGLPRPSFRTWLSGSYSDNVTEKLEAGVLERMRLPESGEALDEMFGIRLEGEPGGYAASESTAQDSSEPGTTTSSQSPAPVQQDSSERIILTGDGGEVRGLIGFYESYEDAKKQARALSRDAQTVEDVDIYSMSIPLASAYYLPESLSGDMTDQRLWLDVYAQELTGVVNVDAYTRLFQHRGEDIYARTDRKWMPLGAYYAGQLFAERAGADYPELSECEAVTIEGFAGDLSAQSGGESLAKAPESFVYYKYGTSAQVEILDEKLGAVGEGELFGENDKPYELASGGEEYLHITSGSTDRVLTLLTDEQGEQLIPFLTAGYGEIWVIARDNGMTLGEIADYTGCTEILIAESIGG